VRLSSDDHVPFSDGDTESAAWRAALAEIEGGRASEDPRRVRAATLRQHVLSRLIEERSGLTAEQLWWQLQNVFPGSFVRGDELRRALAVLRRNRQVRYRRPRWEAVTS
jgi:hypothetical protein